MLATPPPPIVVIKRPQAPGRPMSASPLNADVAARPVHVRHVPCMDGARGARGNSDISTSGSGAAMYTAFECGRHGRRGPARGFARPSKMGRGCVPLDKTLARLPNQAERRIILKIDAESFEPNVIAGARTLLRSGRVSSVLWECGLAAAGEAGQRAMIEMVAFLSDCGFRHFRPPKQEVDGPAIQFDCKTVEYVGNVFSLAPQLVHKFRL